MKNEFVPYEIALALKELGFDELCFRWYGNKDKLITLQKDNNISNIKFRQLGKKVNHICTAPLYQQAFRWLYQKLDIKKSVMPLDIEYQQLLLKELIDKVSSKHLLV